MASSLAAPDSVSRPSLRAISRNCPKSFLHLPGGLRVDGQRAQGVEAELVALRIGKCANENEKVGDALSEDLRALLLDSPLGSQQEIARLGKSGDQGGRADAVKFLGRKKHPGIARVNGEAQHPAARGGDFAGMTVQRAKIREQLLGASEGFLVGPVDPAKRCEVAHSSSPQRQHRLREVESPYLRQFRGRAQRSDRAASKGADKVPAPCAPRGRSVVLPRPD